MTTAIGLVTGALIIINVNWIVDHYARRNHWRLGRLGRLLFVKRKHGGCLRCETDWRWAQPHDTPIRAEDGYCIFPLCDKCWGELSKQERLTHYGAWLKLRRSSMGDDEYERLRVAIWAAVEAGL